MTSCKHRIIKKTRIRQNVCSFSLREMKYMRMSIVFLEIIWIDLRCSSRHAWRPINRRIAQVLIMLMMSTLWMMTRQKNRRLMAGIHRISSKRYHQENLKKNKLLRNIQQLNQRFRNQKETANAQAVAVVAAPVAAVAVAMKIILRKAKKSLWKIQKLICWECTTKKTKEEILGIISRNFSLNSWASNYQ